MFGKRSARLLLGTSVLLAVAGIVAGALLYMKVEARHAPFIGESVSEQLAGNIRVLSSADEADHAFAQLGWAAYYFEFDESHRSEVTTQLRITSRGTLPPHISPCVWSELSLFRRPPNSAPVAWGEFVGGNGTSVTAIVDETQSRGWICIGYGDRAAVRP